MTETKAPESKIIEVDATHVIAWANQAKKGLPKKLYVNDSVVDFDRINLNRLVTLQEDSKYIFFLLTLNDDGSIEPKAVASATPVVAETPAVPEEKPAA